MEQDTKKELTLTQPQNTSLDISRAVSSGVPVKQLANQGYSVKTIEGALAALILKYSAMLHIGGNLLPHEPISIAQMLIGEYPTASLDDFTLMLQRGVMGRYGKVFGFDVSIVFSWMANYMEEWAEEKERQLAKEKGRIKEMVEEEPGEWSPEFKEQFSKFMDSLKDGKVKSMPVLTKQEIREEGQSEPPIKKGSGYIPNPELVIIHEKRMEWIRKYHDPITGKRTEDYLSYEEFIKL